MLHNTVLSNSNTKMQDFVLLMYQFCNHHRTYKTVIRETFLPQDGYCVTKLSDQTINKWFAYFRYLCIEAISKTHSMIGGENDEIEMDETMCEKK